MGGVLKSRRVRWGATTLGALVLGLAVSTALPAGAGTSGAERAAEPDRDGPTAEAQGPRDAGGQAEAAEAAPLAAAALATNLTYSTTEPCRTFDSRQAGGPFGHGAGFSLDLLTPCGLPADGSVKAVMANVIAVDAVGTGYVRAAAWEPTATAPGATILNFNNRLVSSNAVPLTICDQAVMTCDWDLDLWIPAQARSNIVIDIVGYFS